MGNGSAVSFDTERPMKIPPHAIISQEESDKLQREAKRHTIVIDGEYAAHYVHDIKTGVVTMVREAKVPLSR